MKIVALAVSVGAVVATPRGAWAAYGLLCGLLGVAVARSRVPLRHLAPRMLVETPVVLFAALLPVVATGPRVSVIGIPLSVEGLIAGGTLLAKATLGTASGLLLAATTEPRDLIVGLQRLRLPAPLVAILGFMVRYVDVVAEQLRRMRMAQAARGFEPRSVRAWRVLARTGGALFIRSYERGERVHLAMLARGFTGSIPYGDSALAVPAHTWARALALPVAAVAVAVAAFVGGPAVGR